MKRNVLLFFGALTAFAVTVPVLAASTDFLAKAQQWHDKECTKKKPNLEKSLLCYLFEKVREVDAQLSDLEEKVDERARAVRVFDANGKELGPLVDRDVWNTRLSVLLVPLQRIVILDSESGINLFEISMTYHQSGDCSGTPHASTAASATNANEVYSGLAGRSFIIDLSVPPTECVVMHSIFDGTCRTEETTLCGSQTLIPVTLPFDFPVPVPLQYRFE